MTQTHRRRKSGFPKSQGTVSLPIHTECGPQERQAFQSAVPEYQVLNIDRNTMAAFAERLEFRKPLQGDFFLEISDRRLWA